MKKDGLNRRQFLGRSAAALGSAGLAAHEGLAADQKQDTSKIMNYNPDMEYRRLGRTGLMISAVCMGGHWKRINEIVKGAYDKKWLSVDMKHEGFHKNRYDVVTRLIEKGINYIDACTWQEVVTYAKAIKGRRDKMHLGFSWYQEEMRKKQFRNEKALLGTLEKGMKEAGLEYVDLWRITMLSKSSGHTEGEVEEMMKALDKAKQQGKARFTGFSSHDRPHIKWMIEKYPKTVDVVVTPYTAKSKELPKDSVFEAIKKHDVGMFGIKPFSSGSIFKGNGLAGNAHLENDSKIARMAIRYILGNTAVTAPIPGMICPDQVDNMAMAVKERRELDCSEREELERVHEQAWARLPENYRWLRDWEYI